MKTYNNINISMQAYNINILVQVCNKINILMQAFVATLTYTCKPI